MSFDRGKRRRRKPTHTYFPSSNDEERLLQQAIKNSRLDRHRPSLFLLPHGPTFFPTEEEFQGNPLHYIDKIRPIAEKYGIAKIVPPAGWNPPFCVDMKSKQEFQTKEQHLHRLQEGISFGDGKNYNPTDYMETAREKAMEWRDMYYRRGGVKKENIEGSVKENSEKSRIDESAAPPVVSGVTTSDGTGNGHITQDVINGSINANTNANSKNGASSLEKPASDDDDDISESSNTKVFNTDNLERDYWDIVETASQSVVVEYGNDVDAHSFGSGFPRSERGRCVDGTIDVDAVDQPEPKFGTDEFYKETWWNLNNIPNAPDSILRHVKVGINGINVPWMYYGSLFSTFCWHNEDNYLYSINYHHWGAPKQWYGVPGNKKDAEGLEKVFKNYLSMKMRDVPDLLHHITTMFSPRLLQQGGVPVYKIVQNPGEFVVTFPRAFHGGFSYGPNVGEAVNFATHDWIHHGADANERYRSFARPAVFSHDRLTFTMANHLKDQKTYNTCKLLAAELQRVIDEEMRLRQKLLEAGVRDLSGDINLPANRLDQLDEESADYDDKRLCHACKHVCFFSCIACECSQSKVSCLRHSHYMCRCPPEKKYMMIWTQKSELDKTQDAVKTFCENLKKQTDGNAHAFPDSTTSPANDNPVVLPETAPGAAQDLKRQKGKVIDLSVTFPPRYPLQANISAEEQSPSRDAKDAISISTAHMENSSQDAKRQKIVNYQDSSIGVATTSSTTAATYPSTLTPTQTVAVVGGPAATSNS